MDLTFDVLYNDKFLRNEYLQDLMEGIAKVLKVKPQDIHFFGIEKGSKETVLQIINPDTMRVRTFTEEDIRNLE